MQATTRTILDATIDGDPTIDASLKKRIRAVINEKPQRRKLITIKAAAEILDCCELTISRMAAREQIEKIHFSARRVRYDEEQIRRIASEGVKSEGGN